MFNKKILPECLIYLITQLNHYVGFQNTYKFVETYFP